MTISLTDSQDSDTPSRETLDGLVNSIKQWGEALGFSAVAIVPIKQSELARSTDQLRQWVEAGYHGDMRYLERHADLREDPSGLLPAGSQVAASVISVRLDYRPRDDAPDWIKREESRLRDGNAAVVSIYARGRDYHKVLRQRLQRLADRITTAIGPFGFRVCTDSAPVFEVELAHKAGLGWRGKHTLLLSRDAGSMFFLGEIITDLPLPASSQVVEDHCGSCTRCIDICPTQAILGPYRLDANRCISYLTIEHQGSIPEPLRPLIGNRVYGCDDCQLACPWNKFARRAQVIDFDVRHGLDSASLIELFAWSEEQFNQRHAGSAIRRLGYQRWLRNIAVALGNASPNNAVVAALQQRCADSSELVREHVMWALERQLQKRQFQHSD